MPQLVVTDLGVGRDMNILREAWGDTLRAGLFQNDWWPFRESTISEVTPCDFSGYSGLQPIEDWQAPSVSGDRSVMQAAPITWTMGVGGVSNWIFGYYVVDVDGVLLWAHRRHKLPTGIYVVGDNYGIVPKFSAASRYPLREDHG